MYYIPKGHRAAAHVRSGKMAKSHKMPRPWNIGKKAKPVEEEKEPTPQGE